MPRKSTSKEQAAVHAIGWINSGEEVRFVLECPQARQVYLCGDFNRWSPESLRMTRRNGSGCWERRLLLTPGRYEYKFVVDGEWTADPKGPKQAANPFGTVNSVLEIPAASDSPP